MSTPLTKVTAPKTICLSNMVDKTGRNNYLQWNAAMVDELGPVLGNITSVLKTHQPYVVPPVLAADYTPAPDPLQPAITAVVLAALRQACLVARLKTVSDLAKDAPKFYDALYARISPESRLQIGADGAYPAAFNAADPNRLLEIVRRTHFTAVNAGLNPAKALDDLEEAFAILKQSPGESIATFKTEFDAQLRTLASAGMPNLTPAQLVVKFFKKLDPVRHGAMVLTLENNARSGAPYPLTTEAAYELAREWRAAGVATTDARGVSTGAAFILADDARVLLAPPVNRAPRAKSATAAAGSAAAAEKTKKEEKSTKAKPKVPWVERRSCNHCGVVGHLKRDCPELIMIAIGDEEDEDDHYDRAMLCGTVAMMASEASADRQGTILFSPTEIILDCAADLSMNPDASLLTDVTDRARPVHIGGVQADGDRLTIRQEGTFHDLGVVGIAPGGSANILALAQMIDTGRRVHYDKTLDRFEVTGPVRTWFFARRMRNDGSKSRFWTCDVADIDLVSKLNACETVLVETVADNLRRYTAREVKQMDQAEQLMQRLGHMSSAATITLINNGVQNCSVTASDVRNKDAAKGVSVPGLVGKTKKRASAPAGFLLAPRVTQVQQILHIDIFFVKKLPFLVGVLTPLNLCLVQHLVDRGVSCMRTHLAGFVSTAAARNFEVREIRCDGEGAVAALVPELNAAGMQVALAGPGQHVPVVERMIQTLKSRVRAHDVSLPFVMTQILLIWCVRFCAHCVNLQASATSVDKVSPYEQYSGVKLDAKRDLRVAFGDFIMATPSETDNSMRARSEPHIALMGTGRSTGSVTMLSLLTGKVVTRDQFVIQPMPDHVIAQLTAKALRQGYTRGADPTLHVPVQLMDDDELPPGLPSLAEMMPIDGRADAAVPAHTGAADVQGVAPAAGVNGGASADGGAELAGAADDPAPFPAAIAPPMHEVAEPQLQLPDAVFRQYGSRWSSRLGQREATIALLARAHNDATRAELRRQLLLRSQWKDTAFAFKISVRAAIRERGAEATPVIMAELQQMVDKRVWGGVHVAGLTRAERRAIIRSSMFLKDKYLASGAFEKFKARLVAGGDQQDKDLYENLSSPTASTTSILAMAAIAAAEHRAVMVMDIGGAFLNADITSTGVPVHMRLDRIMTRMLLLIDPGHEVFVEPDGTSVVRLDKALYGCVEASALWYKDLCVTLLGGGFVANPYDPCIFNKFNEAGVQTTVGVHVDDLKVTSADPKNLDAFESYMRGVYAEIKVNRGLVVDYIGMTFDYSVPGEVTITMDNCVSDILAECGVQETRLTPATSTLFDIRDAPKADPAAVKHFRTYVAKLLYLAKRVRPECLVAVAFLTTRVQQVDVDDVAKLRRVLGYVRGTRHRGIVLRIGEAMTVRAYIDAAYGVHEASGKSHTGCAIVLGDAGALSASSSKQKIVTKSSTEAELVALSDTAAKALHLRNFVHAQGYDVGPAVLYQDNLGCMALMKRGGPGSERSRHINIRHFWVAEKVADGVVVIEHLGTELMHANVLTKPVQGAQFVRERAGLTNWA